MIGGHQSAALLRIEVERAGGIEQAQERRSGAARAAASDDQADASPTTTSPPPRPLNSFAASTRGDFRMTGRSEILAKFDSKNIALELGRDGKFQAKATGWDENKTLLEGESLTIQSR